MRKITVNNLIRSINSLSKDQLYNYPNTSTKTLINIDHVEEPEGPITIRRFDPEKGEGLDKAKPESISTQMLWRVANAISENKPINLDRILGGSYNTRSALEALLCHTPEFYITYPGRVESISNSNTVKKGHKHLLWLPNNPHESGKIFRKDVDMVVSEIPTQDVVYESLQIPEGVIENGIDIETQRRHIQIQIALVMIGVQLGYKTWLATNDQGVIYQEKRLAELDGVLNDLSSGVLISNWGDAIKAAQYIDCIWFENGRLMPAVMEVEHSTGVVSGLNRMSKFYKDVPSIKTRYVIVAPDEDREKVIREANQEHFKQLNTKFFPYSSVEELWYLCQRRGIKGVTEDFLDCYMESIVVNS